MNYKKHYEKLISKARNRSILKSEYKEVHHIIPKCMGGDDSKDNLISLFPEEHWLAHLLLIKIYPKNKKLLYAVHAMSVRKNETMVRSNKVYGWLKRELREVRSEYFKINNPSSLPKNKKKISKRMRENNPMYNPKVRKKVGDKIKGQVPWNKGLDKTDLRVQKGIYERTEECREKSRQARLGKPLKESTKQILREQRVGKPNFKNGKEVLLISPKGEEILIKHKIAERCRELGLSYKALCKFRNEVVPKSTRKNSFLRESTEGWCLKDLELS